MRHKVKYIAFVLEPDDINIDHINYEIFHIERPKGEELLTVI